MTSVWTNKYLQAVYWWTSGNFVYTMVRENGYTKQPRRYPTRVGCFNFKSACDSYLHTISLDRLRFRPISSKERSPFPSSPNLCLRTTLSFGFKELSCKQYRRTMLNSIRFWIVLHQLVIQTQAPPQVNSSLQFLEYTVLATISCSSHPLNGRFLCFTHLSAHWKHQ